MHSDFYAYSYSRVYLYAFVHLESRCRAPQFKGLRAPVKGVWG